MNLLSLGSSYQNYSGIFLGLSGWAKKKLLVGKVRDITIVKINHCSSLFEGRKLLKLSGFSIRISFGLNRQVEKNTTWQKRPSDVPVFLTPQLFRRRYFLSDLIYSRFLIEARWFSFPSIHCLTPISRYKPIIHSFTDECLISEFLSTHGTTNNIT